ncbi:MAG: sel1 repeat family protein [Bacteroidales bacterium]|jgi:TPR repeat protein|nr:sel1 repeat family protein [Bacteroidales bacterium]
MKKSKQILAGIIVIVAFSLTSCRSTPPKELQQKAEQGDRYAEYLMGKFYEEKCRKSFSGEDNVLSLEWYEKAADQGLDSAQFEIGRYYYHNLNHDIAIDYLLRAAEQGHGRAQYYLGMHYHHYEYEDYEKAAYWTKKSASQNNTNGQRFYAYLLFLGDGVEQNTDSAMYYMRLSANNVQDEGIYSQVCGADWLGDIFLFGEYDIPINLDSAIYYWQKVPKSLFVYDDAQKKIKYVRKYGYKAIPYIEKEMGL